MILNWHVTNTGNFLGCPRKGCLQTPEEGEETEASEAMNLGTQVHTLIESVLNPNKIVDYSTISDEALRLITQSAIFENINFKRSQVTISWKELLERTHITIVRKSTDDTVLEKVSFDIQDPNTYLEKLNTGTFYKVVPDKNNSSLIKFMSKKYIEEETLDIEGHFLSKEFIQETSIAEALDVNMFGSKIVHTERNIIYPKEPLRYKDYDIFLTGTLDAATQNGKLIIDWKTSSQTPSNMIKFANHNLQLHLYKYLMCKELNLPIMDSKGIIVYIVKNKTPKFVPKVISIQKAQVEEAFTYFKQCVKLYIDYKTGSVPLPNRYYSDQCMWCFVRDQCQTLPPYTNWFPKVQDITQALIVKD